MTIHDLLEMKVCIYMDAEEWEPFMEKLEEVSPGINGSKPATEFACPVEQGTVGLVLDDTSPFARLGWLHDTPSSIRWARENGYEILYHGDIETEEPPASFQPDSLFSILGSGGQEVSA